MKKDGEQQPPSPNRPPRPSVARRHGFGSPEGMELTDVGGAQPQQEADQRGGAPRPATGASSTSSPPPPSTRPSMSEESTPPSFAGTPVSPSAEEGQSQPSPSDEADTPSKPGKRRLFLTPSPRKPQRQAGQGATPLPPQQRQPAAPSSSSASIFRTPQTGSQTQFARASGNSGSNGSSQLSSGGARSQGRRPQTFSTPQTSGLSGLSTTPRSSRQLQQTASGRRSFNPLNRISDIFSPQSPSFARSSPSLTPVHAASSSDDASSASSDSSASSVKEPFSEQVSRLNELLTTPAQQLGELGETTGIGSDLEDDDLDSEMEELETSRRKLAEELSRVDYSFLGGDLSPGSPKTGDSPSTPASSGGKGSAKMKAKQNEDSPDDDEYWTPLLPTVGSFPPNFSPLEEGQQPQDQQQQAAKSSPQKSIVPSKPSSASSSSKVKGSGKSSTPGKFWARYSPLKTPPRAKEASKKNDSSDSSKATQKKSIASSSGPSVVSPEAVQQVEDSKTPVLTSPPRSDGPTRNKEEMKTPERSGLPHTSPASPFNPFGLGSPSSSEPSTVSNSMNASGVSRFVPASVESPQADDVTQMSSVGMGGVSDGGIGISTNFDSDSGNIFQSIASFAERLVDQESGSRNESQVTGGSIEQNRDDSTRLLEELDSILAPPSEIIESEQHSNLPAVTPDNRVLVQRYVEHSDDNETPQQQHGPSLLDTRASAQTDRRYPSSQLIGRSTPGPRSFVQNPYMTPPQDRRQLPSLIDETNTAKAERMGFSKAGQSSISPKQEEKHPQSVSWGMLLGFASKEQNTPDSAFPETSFNQPSDDGLEDFAGYTGTRPSDEDLEANIGERSPEDKLKTIKGQISTSESQSSSFVQFPTDELEEEPKQGIGPTETIQNVDAPAGRTGRPARTPKNTSSETDAMHSSQAPSTDIKAEAAKEVSSVKLASSPQSEKIHPDSNGEDSQESGHKVSSADVRQIELEPRIIAPILLDDESDDEIIFDADSPHNDRGDVYDTAASPQPETFYDAATSPQSETTYASLGASKVPTSYDTCETPRTIPAKSYSMDTKDTKTRVTGRGDEDRRNCRSVCAAVVAIILVISVAIIVGYLVGPNRDDTPSESPTPSLRPPTPAPTFQESENPTAFGTISFTTEYEIYIQNGLFDFISEKEYVPALIRSMDMLTYDILVNIAKKKSLGTRRRLTSVVLPTKISDITNVTCPADASNVDLCQSVIAQISLVDADDTWREFRATTELAIEIGRLQFHLQEVDSDCPAEIIDSLWSPPSPTQSRAPVQSPSGNPSYTLSAKTSSHPTSDPTSLPSFIPTPIESTEPTALGLFDFLVRNSFDGGSALNDPLSPQSLAYEWMIFDSSLTNYSSQRILQRYAMATLYYASNGTGWLANDLWLSPQSECDWYNKANSLGSCNSDQELVNLELDLNNLSGSLPSELGYLSSLERLTLRGGPVSYLSGSIPSELGYLTRLNVFFVRGNNITGTIPSEIGSWVKLKELDLSRNRFRGPLPTTIGNFGELELFDVSANSLSGIIPTHLGFLRKVTKMNFEDNTFLSSIPTELGNLSLLRELRGGSNILLSLPSELGKLTVVETLSLKGSNIPGTIPTEFGQLGTIRSLVLKNNVFTGVIPSEIGLLTGLRDQLDLSNNRLSGAIPSEIGVLADLRNLKLHNNMLTGVVPSELSMLSKLTTIQLDANNIEGTIPSEVCATFNISYPAFQSDCADFDDNCPCCTSCCINGKDCTCRHLGTSKEYLCFQQKH